MGYCYRKKKRLLAHDILSFLSKENIRQSVLKETLSDSGLYHVKVYKKYKIDQVRDAVIGDNEFETLKQAMRLLTKENFVSVVGGNSPSEIFYQCTAAGEDAFLEEYFEVENRRDYLEQWELTTKWLLPVFAVIIALASLVVSIVNANKNCKLHSYREDYFSFPPKGIDISYYANQWPEKKPG